MHDNTAARAIDRFLADLELARKDDDRFDLTVGYISSAKDDCKATMLLFDAGLFALSTYHLQQATEKTTKAYLLSTNIISIKEARDINHNSLNGHILLAQKMINYSKGMIRNVSLLMNSNSKLELLKKINKEEVARLPYSDIAKLVDSSDLTLPKHRKLISDAIENIKDRESEGRKTIRTVAVQKGLDEDKIEDEIDNQLDQLRSDVMNNASIKYSTLLPFLYIASAVTYPHQGYTRYPDGNIRPRDYTMNMGIVEATPDLCGRIMKVIECIENEYLSDIESSNTS